MVYGCTVGGFGGLWWAGNVISEDVADGWGTDSGTTEAVQERQLVDWV